VRSPRAYKLRAAHALVSCRSRGTTLRLANAASMRFPVAALLLGSARATYVSDFQEFGYAVVEGFAAPSEVAAMKAEMKTLEAAYWASEEREKVVFRTDAGQEDAQASSRYFFESADRVHFFEEASGKALNKAGHGLHLTDGVFGAYSRSAKVRELLKALGYRRPALPQSMYIFKQPGVGGSVTSHQDATFLRTEPEQTVVGLWLALDDATVDNGCLWLRNRSHFEPLRRVFVRDRDPHEPDPNMVFVHTPPYRESNFFASSLAERSSVGLAFKRQSKGRRHPVRRRKSHRRDGRRLAKHTQVPRGRRAPPRLRGNTLGGKRHDRDASGGARVYTCTREGGRPRRYRGHARPFIVAEPLALAAPHVPAPRRRVRRRPLAPGELAPDRAARRIPRARRRARRRGGALRCS